VETTLIETPAGLTAAVRAALSARADPTRAAQQQRYMKSSMPYHGLTTPQLRAALAPIWARLSLPGPGAWRAAVADLWDTAGHREERYAAVGLLQLPRHRAWVEHFDPATVALLRHLIVTGAWWDHVDAIAGRPVGDGLRARPDAWTPVLREWAHDPDLWLRRAAIICQLLSREATDLELLTEAIEASSDDRDFFARKAIGWALRQHARTDPEWVRGFLASHAATLSPLSVREASKHL
jgi:3-methyladenine DNA glycosylase AlkD